LILEEFEDNSFLPKFYKDPDRYAFPLEMSFLADRFYQLKNNSSNVDLFAPFTIADYYIIKSMVFARKTLKSDEFKLYQKLFEIIKQSINSPDLIVYLWNSVENLQKNIKKRGRDYEQNISDKYLADIQESYFEFIKHQKDLRVLVINTENIDFLKYSDDYEWIKSVIFKDYPKGIHRISR
jgi:deoxyadenosine/deoxycytidine kinase